MLGVATMSIMLIVVIPNVAMLSVVASCQAMPLS